MPRPPSWRSDSAATREAADVADRVDRALAIGTGLIATSGCEAPAVLAIVDEWVGNGVRVARTSQIAGHTSWYRGIPRQSGKRPAVHNRGCPTKGDDPGSSPGRAAEAHLDSSIGESPPLKSQSQSRLQLVIGKS